MTTGDTEITSVDLAGTAQVSTDTGATTIDFLDLGTPGHAWVDLAGQPVVEGTPIVSGPPGPPGANGAPGAPGTATAVYPYEYQWSDTVVQHEMTPGYISGDPISNVIGTPGRFSINQLDQAGLNVAYSNLQAGNQVVIRDADTGSIFILTITLREKCSDATHACFRYTVANALGINTDQPVTGDTVHAAPLPAQAAVDSYTHVQQTPSDTWTISHTLAFRPNVAVVDSTGREVWPGEVNYLDPYTIQLIFSAAFGGTAYLS